MNKELVKALCEAIDNFNEYSDENNQLYWWDIVNNIKDIADDEEVLRVIITIENETSKLAAREAKGL